MPKSQNQKHKLLLLQRIFLTRTDEQHALSVKELQAMLATEGVQAERKSIYDDIAELRASGLDVVAVKTETTRYYVAARTFSLPDLELLAESVLTARFLTQERSDTLLRKLSTLCSVHEAGFAGRQVLLPGRVRSMGASDFPAVTRLRAAMDSNTRVTFRYFSYDADKQKWDATGSARLEVSPWALAYAGETYSLIGYDSAAAQLRHYRVDRMEDVWERALPREGRDTFETLDRSADAVRAFSAAGGSVRRVTIEFENRLADAVIDRFGVDTPFIKCGASKFRIVVPVEVSDGFYGWIFALGGARILAPADVAGSMRALIEKAAE